MKTNKLIMTGLLGCGLISQADAANQVYITGSTAFRSQAFLAIKATFDGGNPQLAARGGSAASGNNANYMLFHGTIGTVETYVDCHWSGSEDGIATVAAPGSNPTWFLKTDGSVPYTVGSTNPASGETNASPTAPDLCFADSSQAVSLTKTPALVPQGTGTPAGSVGIVPFVWVKNKQTNPSNSWTRLSNMTDSLARQALTGPNIAALFTGNASDTNQYVYVVGRNNRSGTRVDTLAACRYGITKPVDQWAIGGFPSSDGVTLALTEVINDGYDTGGSVANALKIDGSCQQTDPVFSTPGWFAIGYVGIGDANTLLSNGGVWLTYNGATYSNGAVEEGQYSFWNHEYLFGRVGISGNAATFGSALAAAVPLQLGGANPALQDTSIREIYMHADKPSDTGDPFHL
jgi:hypothetical protein